MNATHNVLANGNRANATIGRAIRLVLINLLGCMPGQLDRSTLGHPGKYTFCIAEDEEDSPWTPLAQERAAVLDNTSIDRLKYPRYVMSVFSSGAQEAETPQPILGFNIDFMYTGMGLFFLQHIRMIND